MTGNNNRGKKMAKPSPPTQIRIPFFLKTDGYAFAKQTNRTRMY